MCSPATQFSLSTHRFFSQVESSHPFHPQPFVVCGGAHELRAVALRASSALPCSTQAEGYQRCGTSPASQHERSVRVQPPRADSLASYCNAARACIEYNTAYTRSRRLASSGARLVADHESSAAERRSTCAFIADTILDIVVAATRSVCVALRCAIDRCGAGGIGNIGY